MALIHEDFEENFKEIACVGAVGLMEAPNDDYAKYAIHIRCVHVHVLMHGAARRRGTWGAWLVRRAGPGAAGGA